MKRRAIAGTIAAANGIALAPNELSTTAPPIIPPTAFAILKAEMFAVAASSGAAFPYFMTRICIGGTLAKDATPKKKAAARNGHLNGAASPTTIRDTTIAAGHRMSERRRFASAVRPPSVQPKLEHSHYPYNMLSYENILWIIRMMILDNLALFLRIVEKGGLASAGRELGLSPASVSERLGALEKYYGAALLHRTTRAISLTDEGRLLAEGARRLLAEADELEALIRLGVNKISGPIKLSAPIDLGRSYVVPILDAFLVEHPEVTIDLNLTDG